MYSAAGHINKVDFFQARCCDAVIRTCFFSPFFSFECKYIIGLTSSNCSVSCLGLQQKPHKIVFA